MEVFCWQLRRVLTKKNVTCIGHISYFTFSFCLFRWCPSLGAFILLFPPKAPSFSSKFNLRMSVGVCLCYEGPCPPCANFNLFRNHFYFASFSSFKFVLAMFRLFDGIIAKSRRIFSIQHVQVSIHPFNSPIVKGHSCMVFEHFRNLFDLKDSTNNFS